MSRADRRRFDKEFKRMAKTENCTICGKALAHNSRTFGGLGADGNIVLAGECCEHTVATPMVTGVYLTRGIDGLLPLAKSAARNGGNSPENIDGAIGALQSHFRDLDSRTLALMRQGGIPTQAKNIFLADHPWKTDDAAWFKDNPNRSHRLRPMLDGEAATLPPEITMMDIPENQRLEILVRQVEPGTRIRTVFCRNTEFVLPDQEEFMHALFDTVANAGNRGIIDAQKINDLAKKYASCNSPARPNSGAN